VWYGYTIRNWLIGDERSVLIIKLTADGEERKSQSVMLIRLSIQIFATDRWYQNHQPPSGQNVQRNQERQAHREVVGNAPCVEDRTATKGMPGKHDLVRVGREIIHGGDDIDKELERARTARYKV
jgi:hypothetical protein